MNYVKISNLFKNGSKADYKGLDLKNIQRGSQVYPPKEDVAYIFYDGEIPNHNDLQIITESDYQSKKEEIKQNRPQTDRERINNLQETLDQLVVDSLGGMS